MTKLVPPAGNPGAPPRESKAVPAGGNAEAPAVVDGVDLDAVAAAACGCPAVDDLSAGGWGGVVSYLPGRQVAGVRIASDHVVISVRGRWGIPVSEMARQVRAVVGPLVAPRRVDLVVADLAGVPGDATAGGQHKAPAAGQHEEVGSWTTSRPGAGPGASSSVPITPTAAATPEPSPPGSPPTTGSPILAQPPG